MAVTPGDTDSGPLEDEEANLCCVFLLDWQPVSLRQHWGTEVCIEDKSKEENHETAEPF